MLHGFSKRKLFDNFEIEKIYNLYDDETECENLIKAYLLGKHHGKKLNQQEVKKTRWKGFTHIDPTVARENLLFERKNVAKLLETRIKNFIDNGFPVAWGVFMNFDPKDGRESGHMRVLVGYTLAKNGSIKNFLYSDSWGDLSLEQTVSFDDATLMTSALYIINPRQKTAIKTNDSSIAILPRNIQLHLVKIPASEKIQNFTSGNTK